MGERNVYVAVEIIVPLEGDEGRVGMAVGEEPEAGPGGVAAADHAAHLVGGPVGDVGLLGQMPGAVAVLVVAHAVGEGAAGMALFAEPELVVVDGAEDGAALLGEDDVVEADAIALGKDVELADGVGLVAGVAEGLGDGRELRHGFLHLEDAVAVGAGGCAGHEGAAGRYANGALGVGVGVADTGAGEAVQRWSADGGMTGTGHEVGGPVVGGDEQDRGRVGAGVGLGCHCGAPDLSGIGPGRRWRPGLRGLYRLGPAG